MPVKTTKTGPITEEQRLRDCGDHTAHWKRWGPYLSERAWGTVREDYSADGNAWTYLTHDHARSRTYRWNEDGIGGISDRHQRICFALALWNGHDPILKERMFGLTGSEGNHGEDVKEYYFYLDSTPTHSYMKFLYKYPQRAYPYEDLVKENGRRGKRAFEYELLDTGIFAESRYFDVFIEYAKATPEDICIKITAINRGPEAAPLHLLPTVWFRNTWSWGHSNVRKPRLGRAKAREAAIELNEPYYGERWLCAEGNPTLLFTENETNVARLFGGENASRYVKDAFHEYVVHGQRNAVNPEQVGTKAAAHYGLVIGPGESAVIRLRLSDQETKGSRTQPLGADFDDIFEARQREADAYYADVIPGDLSEDGARVMRQALAGMLWSKQFYHYVTHTWLEGDPAGPPPPAERLTGRNHEWGHLFNADVLSMPDTWEYPWYAAWDLAFHTIPLAIVDPEFAKDQLSLVLREWYMHPNGQIPAYEWAFGDVNPPVHAWASLRVYQIERKRRGVGDVAFLERIFHKLLLNFTWWVNRKDADGKNIFQGGFLGLDNIGVFDRSAPLPTGGYLEQSDGTSWMAMYTLNMLGIALELACSNPAYEDVASKFWEHFLHIAAAMSNRGPDGISLWDDQDGFFYDVLHVPPHEGSKGRHEPLKVRSMVGLIPLYAVETLDTELLDRMPGFKRRMQWFLENRPDLTANVACMRTPGETDRRLMSVVGQEQLKRVLAVMLDEEEFLSPHGIRAVSRYHKNHPYILITNGMENRVDYEPAESSTGLFGGNSNWRGPIWFPVNYLLIESLQKYHYYYGDSLKVECPTGSGVMMNLWEVAAELSRRLTRLFLRDPETGERPIHGGSDVFQNDPHWRDCLLFHEYFHGDNGAGIGASHQTGWTGLVAKLLQQNGEWRPETNPDR